MLYFQYYNINAPLDVQTQAFRRDFIGNSTFGGLNFQNHIQSLFDQTITHITLAHKALLNLGSYYYGHLHPAPVAPTNNPAPT